MTTRQRQGAKYPLFPQTIAVSDKAPLSKVTADYLPPPKNQFQIKVNDQDYFTLMKEELGVDLS